MSAFWRCASGLLGLFIFLFVHLLKSEEEIQIQNWLVDLWANTGDRSSQFLTKQAVFLRESARVTSGLLKRAFGSKLISFTAVRTCVTLCFASLLASLAVASLVEPALETQDISFASDRFAFPAALFMSYITILCAAFVVLIGVLPVIFRRWYIAFLGGIASLAFFLTTVSAEIHFKNKIGLAFLSTFLGVALDLAFIRLLIRLLDKLSNARNATAILTGFLSALAIAIALATPFIAGTHVILLDYKQPSVSHLGFFDSISDKVPIDLFFVSAIMALNVFCCSLIFCVMALGGMHKLLWPLVIRILESAYRKQWLTTKTGWLSAIAGSLLVYAVFGETPLEHLFRRVNGGK